MDNESNTSGPAPAELALEGFEDFVEIGRGGFGVVYRATDAALSRTVAIKVLTAQLDSTNQRRFDRERKALGSLSGHPNIVTVYGSGFLSDGRPYILMEFLPGGSLADRLEAGPVAWSETIEIGIKVAGALERAHKGGVLHRDIKPENVLMSEFGEPKLGDFGIAKVADATVTRAGSVSASVAHAPPEILNGDPASEASDVYSLGSTLYTLLAGGPAFVRATDETMVPVYARIATEPVPDLRAREVPDPVSAVVEDAMAKTLDQRIPSAAELRDRLVAARAGAPSPEHVATTTTTVPPPLQVDPTELQPEPVAESAPVAAPDRAPVPTAPPPAPTAAPSSRSRKGLLIAAAGLGAAVLIGGAALLLGGGGGSDERRGRVAFFTLEAGECWNEVANPDDVRIVDCDQPHDGETFATVPHNSVSFPGQAALDRFGASECGARLDRYAPDATLDVSVAWTYPTGAGWEAGERSVVCSAVDADGGKLEGSVASD